ncbi:peptidase S24/S26A/S26B/S26C [Pseudomassariella vexata]|uniref:Peptidase S24/S26A/S26B/S26C n=1 Tax=Pseudomassariella vexata TaxID=1141098 RepID=A0A1Y2EK25_9PEZI|nr:peptidase S24/S26A/S26B/S26C [Pseudomassariella vexata]ORY71898.1 peptidase S24/S26A/S26B/S26C [Pseudomassariella vexata]
MGFTSRYYGHPFRVLFSIGKSVAFAHLIWNYGVAWGSGSGASMMPTFPVLGKSVIIDRRCRRGRNVQVGDCVVYNIPIEPGEEGIKRVLGMPGDYVLMNSPDCKNRNHMIQVPEGHCYIMGDNLPWSRDSRDFGPLPLALIKGKVVATSYLNGWNPLKWWSKFDNGLKPVDTTSE